MDYEPVGLQSRAMCGHFRCIIAKPQVVYDLQLIEIAVRGDRAQSGVRTAKAKEAAEEQEQIPSNDPDPAECRDWDDSVLLNTD